MKIRSIERKGDVYTIRYTYESDDWCKGPFKYESSDITTDDNHGDFNYTMRGTVRLNVVTLAKAFGAVDHDPDYAKWNFEINGLRLPKILWRLAEFERGNDPKAIIYRGLSLTIENTREWYDHVLRLEGWR